jgi:hypothetical protein
MRGLTKNLRKRAAIAIAVAYAFCVMTPAAALAVIASPTVFHCIGELNAKAVPAVQQTAAHIYEDCNAHHHGQASHDHGNPEQVGLADHHSDAGGKTHGNNTHGGTCCGLFCVSAIAHDPGLIFGASTAASSAVAMAASGLTGRAPCPLHRPPIA